MGQQLPEISWIDTQHSLMARRTSEWADVNTGTANRAGLDKLSAVVQRAFIDLGGTVQTLALKPAVDVDARGELCPIPLGNATRVVMRPTARMKVFLGIHIDTVYPPDHPFQGVTVDGNKLRGPGVADAKGGLAVMLTTLEAFERSDRAAEVGWEVLINPDEEIGSPGSAPLLAGAAKNNQLGLVFEPALPGGALADRRRGVGNFAVVFRGRSAHAGRDFDRGRSAVMAMAELALRAHALNAALPGVTVNVGRVEGGGAVNVVPDLALCRINVRTTVPEDENRLRHELDRLVAEAGARDGITAELLGSFSSPPKIPDDPTRALMDAVGDCGRELGISIEWRTSGGACDGNKLAAAGLPTIDSLGPRGGDIHSPGEYLELDSLTERAKLTALLLIKLSTGEIRWPPRYH